MRVIEIVGTCDWTKFQQSIYGNKCVSLWIQYSYIIIMASFKQKLIKKCRSLVSTGNKGKI